jgi:two-component system response regulator FlrC
MSQARVLVVEDDHALREVIRETLELAKYDVVTAASGQDALRILDSERDIGLLISDVQMQPMDGHELLRTVRSRFADLSIILMTAYGTVEKAVQAMHDGANDYLIKPFDAGSLVDVVSRYSRRAGENDDNGLIAVDARSREMAEVAKRVAATDATVMISGESGVGKEVVSRYIHRYSRRAQGPFVAINCAAIPENMLESVLFGYEKGAFTGAHQSTPGKFELAQGGTLLLDEVTEMELGLQAKLLRVLQEREVERLGGRKPIALDVRVLATTNRDIHECVSDGSFREDLFYRLNVFPLKLLPLRHRRDDIMPLARRLVAAYTNAGVVVAFSAAAEQQLFDHSWPGNVRELDNVIQRAMILKTGNVIEACDLSFERIACNDQASAAITASIAEQSASESGGLNNDLKAHEQDLIISALKARNSRREVAEKLGISPRTLRYKLARLRDAGVAIPA